jgi:hypothetical protein
MPTRLILAVLPLLLLAACAAPRDVAEVPRPLPPPEVEGPPAYETFDPSDYDVEPRIAPVAVDVVHDVPDELMAGRIVETRTDPSEPRVLQGYRIQLFSSESKPSADAVHDDVSNWWRSARGQFAEDEIFPFGLQPAVVFTRPYYRVRVGAYPTRDDARLALELLRERYAEAFIVPDTITVLGE